MEWSWLRDWWRLAKFRRGDRTDPTVPHHRRRASGTSAASAFASPLHEEGADEWPDDLEPVRFFVDRSDHSNDDDDGEHQSAGEASADPEDEQFLDGLQDPHLYLGSMEAMYNCECETCLMNGDLDPTDGLDSDDSSTSGKQVVVAVCAMSKKSQSKPMKEILTRLQEFEYIRMVVIGEDIILDEPVDRWPLCDCLISFHSKGFPLEKAIQYAQLRQPYVINNLHMQFDIQDRRRVYAILEQEGIEIPRYAVLDRDSPDPKQHELVESEDHVEVNGIVFNKPFVEKPVSAEDHNIYIYYPTSAGGGSQRLFRKIGSRSSVYSPESRVRKTGSFIYEDFMPTDGTDVKVYTVGPDYAHAEARKSPALDGKVERDSDGKEIRYPVILSNAEKLISRKVCLAFKQTVCGFDLLRANGKSFVCDVNGFSFVKNSNKYYDDCAKILGNMILRELAPQLHIPWSVPFQLDDPPIVPTTFGKMMELRCVTAVIRHGDRTPKQKMKVEVRHQKFFEIFEKYDGYRYGHIKLKRPKQLQEILDIARSLLAEIQTKAADSEIEEKQSKLEQLKSVLEMYGHFSGINRKVQMKYQPKGRPRGSSSDDGKHDCTDAPKEPSLVLILKWGGELTPAGRIQAEELGRIFRCMYPGGQSRQPGVGEGPGAQGLGLLRLHSTFRHDLKIYASDEGRVQMTAAAFAKGLLALEGELTPILVQMVKSANTNGLLDNDCDSSKYQNMAKSRLHELMQIDREFTAEDRAAINPGNAISINLAMNFVKNPVQCCAQVHSLIRSLMAVVAVKRDDPKTRDAVLYHGETWELMGRRWGKIEKDFCTKNKNYDISKIPDIYDCIKYDLQHNQHTLQFDLAEELYISAKYLADIVIPQEYGLTMHEKLTIGQGICTPLLKKIRADLQRNIEELGGEESVNRLNPRYSHGVSSPGRHVRTRLYFTSESHVHSLLTVLRHGGLLNVLTDEQWRRAMDYVSMVSELNYMSQIVIMLYEDPMKDPSSEERFHVELHFSPGVNCCVQKNLPPGPGFRPHSRNDSVTSKNASGDEDTTSRIDEENDTEEENSFSNNSSLHHTPTKTLSRTDTDIGNMVTSSGTVIMKERRIKKMKSSSPIPIGSCHTVSGHEALDLAKRLSEELAVQQQQQQHHQLHHLHHHHQQHHQHQQQHLLQQHHHHMTGSFGCGNTKDISRPLSPDSEPRARSFEHQQQHHHGHQQHHHHHGKMHHHRSKIGKGGKTLSRPLSAEESEAVSEDTIPALCIESNVLEVDQEKDVEDDDPKKNRPSLYIGPPESSYSCDSISEFTPNLDDQELYVSSFSESEDDQQRQDTDGDASGSEPSRYYSALGQHDCEPDSMLGHSYLRRSLSYTFSNDPARYNANVEEDSCCGSKMSNTKLSGRHGHSAALMTRSFDELLTDIRDGAHGEEGNCCCSFCWMSDVPDFAFKVQDVAGEQVESTRRSRTNSVMTRSHDFTDYERLRMVRYPVRAMTRFASDPSLPLGRGWAEACCNAKDRDNLVFVTLTTPPPPDEDDSEPLLRQLRDGDYITRGTQWPGSSERPYTAHCSDPGRLAGTGVGGGPASASLNVTTVRRQRHSIAGQMSYFKMLGTFSKKMATSTNSLFSTAVISGSSSAPNLRDMIPSTASPSGFGGVPPIRPLETLHNALSLKQLDAFLERMTIGPLFKTPASSPPPKHPLITAAATAQQGTLSVVSDESSIVGEADGSAGTAQLASSSIATIPHGSSNITCAEERNTTRGGGIRDTPATIGQHGTPTAAAASVSAVPTGVSGPGGGSTSANGGGNVSGVQQSWSDHSSSMTSSISALSSGGPSSPNYSEVYSRGCPSSDMSASITSSTDGSLAAIASGNGASEQLVALPHLFNAGARISSPKHPPTVDLAGKGEQVGEAKPLDDPNMALAAVLDSETDADGRYLRRRSSTMDISGDLTPVSVCSDWGDGKSNDATKGSTTHYDSTTTNTAEEDDEDATISTDTCLSVGEQRQQQHQQQWPSKTGLTTDGACTTTVSGTGPAMMPSVGSTVGGKITQFHDAFPFDDPLSGRASNSLDTGGSVKTDGRVRGIRIQRQISLYEKENRSEVRYLPQAHEWSGRERGKLSELGGCGSRQHHQHCPPHATVQQPRFHMSFDELADRERSIKSQLKAQEPPAQPSPPPPPATPHTPGALLIREGFIEPPRLTRVTKSFHGKTNHQRFSVEQTESTGSSSSDGGVRRASDGPVTGTATRYNKTTLRQQHSSVGSSSQGRFTTSLVQEAEQCRDDSS
uniref:Inositol hexakisphosphate and diphosphoinositol-pentakisphosphate kinase n=1 Tax=Anopheles epiroticus TaxID=199890 RepID=A0A182PL38_9DIPT